MQSREIRLVADRTKFGRHALVRLGNIAQIDKFFTDAPVPLAALEAFEKAGVEVLVAAGT